MFFLLLKWENHLALVIILSSKKCKIHIIVIAIVLMVPRTTNLYPIVESLHLLELKIEF